ncbi:hypothetical protein UFOVP36_27 [uncultured Caudovirales phage]|uniref:Uncharacterized protein n=1 Tax=uncultured Caudovirales phage TaxID=2100421 RepID=A0A6J5KQ27_9CAUD|nr:hypothetical protein UFOVP36_27 [uncultured Caudovirales phage]
MDTTENTLRDLYAKRDELEANLNRLDRQIMREAREWAKDRGFLGLGQDRVRSMILRPF